jgi:hypothetical protein
MKHASRYALICVFAASAALTHSYSPALAAAAQSARSTAPQGSSARGRIPNGSYKCQTWIGSSYVSLGTVRSQGGVLNTDLLRKVGATFTGATATADGVTISYTTARGYRESMDCKKI